MARPGTDVCNVNPRQAEAMPSEALRLTPFRAGFAAAMLRSMASQASTDLSRIRAQLNAGVGRQPARLR
jgi:hypothetical protein